MKKIKSVLLTAICSSLIGLPAMAKEEAKLASSPNIQRDSIIVRIATGDVERKSANGEWVPIAIGSDLSKDDVVRTGKNSSILIELPENSGFVRVLPESELKVSRLKVDRTFEGGQITEFSLNKGKVVTKVRKFNRKSSKLHINTKGATAAVRGTSFMTSFNENSSETKVIVGDGKVAVKSDKSEVLLNPKEFSKVNQNGNISYPANVEEKIDFSISALRANDSKLNISGVTTSEAEAVSMNKTVVFPNNDGSFTGNVYLKDGSNSVTIKASTIDGRTAMSNLEVLKFTD